MVKEIVLTGGPCAGKTTALAKIEQDLKQLGYKVFIVAESATEIIKSGISPVDIGLYEFQKLLLIYQIQKEELYKKIAKEFPGDKKVIIYDRGIFDNKAYVSEKEFKEILKYVSSYLNMNLTESDIINRYDMVMHLVTSAEGDAKNYTLENNKARTETIEQARNLDKKTMECWAIHNNLQIIDNYETFEEKINVVLNTIHNFLGNPSQVRKERKFLVDNNVTKEILKDLNYIETNIDQYYINTDRLDKYERRLRKITYKDGVNYYYCVQGKEKYGIKKVMIERRLTKQEFEEILKRSNIISKLNKTRISFTYNKQYLKLDLFDDLSILEVQGEKRLSIPSFIKLLKEVTDDINYQNINLGNNKKNKLLEIK